MYPVTAPPFSALEPVIDILHGIPFTDPYRWLEDQNSLETRAWIEEQTRYARAYLDHIPGRERIRARVQELLDVETFDSFLKCGRRYIFRKRLPGNEQPSIYLRDGIEGQDRLLVDPALRHTTPFTSVKPLKISRDGLLLLYEVKQGGERAGTFEILDVANRRVLPDKLPHGYLRGFAFAPDNKSFYYVHETAEGGDRRYHAAFHHILGTDRRTDREIFRAGEGEKLRLVLVSSIRTLGFLVYHFQEKTYTDFYLLGMGSTQSAIPVLRDAEYRFAPRLLPGRIFAMIDEQSANGRVVEVQPRKNQNPLYFELVPEQNVPLRRWEVTANQVLASYVRGTRTEIRIYDHLGNYAFDLPCSQGYTTRIAASSIDDDDLLLERESFTQPTEILHYNASAGAFSTWARRSGSLNTAEYGCVEVSFSSKDGTAIPMFSVGRRDALEQGAQPVAMTAYGGYGVPMTPQFGVLVAYLMERGCLFALPNIRGGSEFGACWHVAAKRQHRQVAFDDFLSAADWLKQTGRVAPDKLAIFGGSNSGLLVAAAATQRPELFRAVLCIAPILDMLRYHLFDDAHLWKEEFGTAENAQDFAALASYSPYHAVRDGIAYPAVMFVSGDADQNCNALHARKMVARLQSASSSPNPIFLDYNPYRGHSPVLPLSVRVDALTDRLAFLCDRLGLAI